MNTQNDNFTEYDFKYHQGLLANDPYDVLKSRDAYNEFVASHPELKDMSYDSWVDLIIELQDNKTKPTLGFVPSTNLGGIAAAGVSAISSKMNLNDLASSTIDNIVDAGSTFIKQQVNQRMNNAKIPPNIKVGGGAGKGDGGTTTSDYSSGSSFNPTGLSLNLKPILSNFKTDIQVLYRPKFFLDGRDDTAPLVIKYKNVWPEYDSTNSMFAGSSKLNNYVQTKVIADWINVVSRKVRPNTFTSSVLNVQHIVGYYQTMHYCLSVLYFYRSIIAHFQMEKNRNEAMIKLYETFSLQDLQDLYILGKILDEVPLDPVVNEFTFHLYENYKQSYLPGSPLIKFSPVPFADSTDNYFNALATGKVGKCIDMLKNDNFRKFQQLYVQAFPNSCDTKTYAYSGIPQIDPNWLTSWVNSAAEGATQTYNDIHYPMVSSDDDLLRINLHTDAPDGWIEAADAVYNSTSNQFTGGFGGYKELNLSTTSGFPISDRMRSQYVSGGGAKQTTTVIATEGLDNAGNQMFGFFPIELRESYVALSGNTYNAHLTSPVIGAFQRFATERAEPRTVRDMIPCSEQFADLMYTPWKFDQKTSSASNYTNSVEDDTPMTNKKKRRRRK